ncbi:MAG TPA: sigma-70 family RNA polymerase sigma factor [Verrucomicrobiae bacterium]|jgi:RNA polymerase sigma-70 factor (ECF subfamily)
MTLPADSIPLSLLAHARANARALELQTPPESADAEVRLLVAALRRGAEEAFRQLYDRYQERLFRFALVLGRGDEALASEIVQSVFVTAAAKLRQADGEAHVWNWLARVARQHLAKAWRQRQKESAIFSSAEIPDVSGPEEADSLIERMLDEALLALDLEQRNLLEWFYFDHASHKDIAQRLQTTPKAVSSRLDRARAALRTYLNTRLSHER